MKTTIKTNNPLKRFEDEINNLFFKSTTNLLQTSGSPKAISTGTSNYLFLENKNNLISLFRELKNKKIA